MKSARPVHFRKIDPHSIARGVAALAFMLWLPAGCGTGRQSAQSKVPQTSTSAGNADNGASEFSSATGAPATNPDANMIRQAIEDHVRSDRSINMAAMDMVIESLNVSGDKAEASATFRIKQGGGNMAMLYSLERRGSGWAVVNSRPSDGQFVHPPVDGSQSAAPPNTASPAIPDVQEFLKNHPSHQR